MDLAFVYVAKGLEVSFKVLNKVPANATVGWDFGVSEGSSTDINPTFTYESPGYYNVTLTITEPPVEEGGERIKSTVSQTVMVTDIGVKTHLNDSIYNLIDLYVPANLVSDGMSLQEKATYIQKWQLYIGPLVDRCIPVEEYTNELQYEGLENQLIMELAVWDFLNVQITSLLTGTGQYIDSLTYESTKTKQSGDEEDIGDDEGKAGRVKRIQTGPTEVEYFDDLSDSLSTLYKAYSEALKPGGVMELLRQNLCNLASRLMIFLPFCDNSYRPVKVPRVVNRRHPKGIDGPNPPTLLNHFR